MTSMSVLDAGGARMLLRQMLLIRRFEEKCAELYAAGKIRGFLHLYVGEEACAVGVCQALGPDDAIVSTYREHGHALARGVPATVIMAEMFGKAEGCSRGRGGSMHLFDKSRRFYGGNAIVAGGLPVAVGLALADVMLGRRRVTACFFGDGAVAEGEFHEAMNLASLWRLPVLFLCENNLFAMGTSFAHHQAQRDLQLKAAGYSVPAASVDGMDVLEVEDAARDAVTMVREGRGPFFLELRTYRFRAHSMFDPELYRHREEVDRHRAHDPIQALYALAREEKLLGDADVRAIEEEVAGEIAASVDFADRATLEPVEALTADVSTPRAAGKAEVRP